MTIVRLLAAAAILFSVTACAFPWAGGSGAAPAPSRATPATLAPVASGAAGLDPDSGLPFVARGDLPAEAAVTLAAIDAGGPFPYRQDGSVFENREGLLPDAASGYYHEYTVATPGSTDRGARRIVVGNQGEAYWTDDHYESFRRIAP